MDGAVQLIPNKFVYYRVYDGEVFLLADDVARAAGYTQKSNSSGTICALKTDSGIGLTAPRSYLFYEGSQRLFWGKTAFLDFCTRARETKQVGGRLIMDKILSLYSSLKNIKPLVQESVKAKALRAYIIDSTMHIKFEGEESTKATKAFVVSGDTYTVEIKKKGYGKYTFNKQDVPKF